MVIQIYHIVYVVLRTSEIWGKLDAKSVLLVCYRLGFYGGGGLFRIVGCGVKGDAFAFDNVLNACRVVQGLGSAL
jgi:hypothetical protein